MGDLEVEYKKESFYGDIIEVQISVGEISTISFEFYYQLFTTRNKERILLVKAKTGMICYDYSAKKVAPVPEKFKQVLFNLHSIS